MMAVVNGLAEMLYFHLFQVSDAQHHSLKEFYAGLRRVIFLFGCTGRIWRKYCHLAVYYFHHLL